MNSYETEVANEHSQRALFQRFYQLMSKLCVGVGFVHGGELGCWRRLLEPLSSRWLSTSPRCVRRCLSQVDFLISDATICVRLSLAMKTSFVLRLLFWWPETTSSEESVTLARIKQRRRVVLFNFFSPVLLSLFLLLGAVRYYYFQTVAHIFTTPLNKSGPRFFHSLPVPPDCCFFGATHMRCESTTALNITKLRERLSNSSLWNHTQTCFVIISCFVIPFFHNFFLIRLVFLSKIAFWLSHTRTIQHITHHRVRRESWFGSGRRLWTTKIIKRLVSSCADW